MMRQLPHDLKAERAVLGAVLIEPTTLDQAAAVLSPDDWYATGHRLVWESMLAIHGRDQGIDLITLQAELEARGKLAQVGAENLLQLPEAIPSPSMIDDYARLVRQAASRRRMIQVCSRATEDGFDGEIEAQDYLDGVERSVFEAAQESVRAGGLSHLNAALRDSLERATAAQQTQGGITGARTGIDELDRMTTGMHPGELIVVAGRPGMGKTGFAGGAALQVAGAGAPVAIFSLEMSSGRYADRLVSNRGRIDGQRLRGGTMTKDEWSRFGKANLELNQQPLHIDDTPAVTLMHVRAECRRLTARSGALGLVVVDYLQLMRSGGKHNSREAEVAEISRGLKALSKEIACPVMALAQLNRGVESRSDKRPMLSDLRESGAIEQDADTVWFLYRDEVYDQDSDDAGVAEIVVSKQRNGPTGTARARFFAESARFVNLSSFGDEWEGEGRQ